MRTKNFSTKAELFCEMYKLVIANVEYYQNDVNYDIERITNYPKEDEDVMRFHWVVRQHGTHLCETAFDAAKTANDWKKELRFVAIIQTEFVQEGRDGDSYNYTLQVIDKTEDAHVEDYE